MHQYGTPFHIHTSMYQLWYNTQDKVVNKCEQWQNQPCGIALKKNVILADTIAMIYELFPLRIWRQSLAYHAFMVLTHFMTHARFISQFM